jgi:CubicO group peptidase (beta-lactamase class C family)
VESGDAFQIGSCTKAMTDTLLAILIERGRLRWDSTLGELYPDLWDTMMPVYRDVTVEQLMMHRAGMAADAVPPGKTLDAWYEIPGETRRAQRLNYVEQVLQLPPDFQPCDRFNYSNTGYIVLGSIAEQITGRDWEDLMRK